MSQPGALSMSRARFSRLAAGSAQRVSAWTSAQRSLSDGVFVIGGSVESNSPRLSHPVCSQYQCNGPSSGHGTIVRHTATGTNRMKISRLALILSIIALVLLLIGGPGYRMGLWGLGFGLLDTMRYALFAGAAGALLAIVFLVIPRTRAGQAVPLVAALVLGLCVAAVPVYVRSTAESLPFIHDITTDTTNPPEFVDVRPLRQDAPNPPEYAGEEVAAQQREGYPDLEPLETEMDPEALVKLAEDTAREQGWEIVSAVTADGRIEATDTTLWYGFKDDIVIRVRATEDGSILDVRSKSRVGGSDLGKNAARIREYLDDLRDHLDAQ